MSRVFSAYELNHLKNNGFKDIDTDSIGDSPVEYVTGHAEFRDLDFLVNPSTLIPRLESEKIVDLALQFISQENISHPAIADVGTGSGCLGISLAVSLSKKQIPYTIYLSDISEEALKIAGQNADNLLSSRVNLFFQTSSLMTNYPKIRFDVILANLPYIPSANISTLDSSVKDFEPVSALDGGPDGTHFINLLLQEIPDYLNSRGLAIFEINDTHAIEDFHIPNKFKAEIKNDTNDVPRFLLVNPNQ